MRVSLAILWPSRSVELTGGFRALESSLANHLIRLEKDMWGNREPKGLSRLEIDDQLKLHRLLHRQVRRLGAFQDTIHIVGLKLEKGSWRASYPDFAVSGHFRPS